MYDFIAIQALGALCMGVGSKDSVPAGFPKKNSGLAPEGLSILAGAGAGHPPLWYPTMALKIKIPGGSRGISPWRFFSLFLCVKKGGARRPNLTITCGFLYAHAIKHMLCFGTSFLCAEKGGKDAGSFAGFHEEKIGTFSGSPGAKLPAAFLLPYVATS